MSQVISAIQRKGGVAKSTCLICLAAQFSFDGAKVLIIDTDPQETCVKWEAKKECGVDVTAHLDDETLLDIINETLKVYDIILIDTAGYQSAMAVYSMSASDLILVPTPASEPDAVGAIKTIRHIKNVTVNNMIKPKVRAIFTDVDKNTNITDAILTQMMKAGVEAIKTPLWHRTGFKEVHSTGGRPSGSALTVLNEFIAEMQIEELLDFYKRDLKRGC
ncbi:MAG TPA: ParA family protein [Candidatus Scalindua sp.]|nr:ParA family protein [Candidatus Scalindua sp.]